MCFSRFVFDFFAFFCTLCRTPARSSFASALQNSPFADLLAFVLSAIECFFSAPSLLGATPDPKYRGEITLSGGPPFRIAFQKNRGPENGFFFRARPGADAATCVAACSVFVVTTCVSQSVNAYSCTAAQWSGAPEGRYGGALQR